MANLMPGFEVCGFDLMVQLNLMPELPGCNELHKNSALGGTKKTPHFTHTGWQKSSKTTQNTRQQRLTANRLHMKILNIENLTLHSKARFKRVIALAIKWGDRRNPGLVFLVDQQ